MTTIIKLTTAKSIVNIVLKGSSKVEINWGDGTSVVYKLSEESCKLNHSYVTRAIAHKIVITGDDISYLFCNDNELSSLDGRSELSSLASRSELSSLAGKGELTLSCGNNKLTSLSVAGFSNIISLDCRNNQLSGKALDGLFDSLPKISPKVFFGKLFIAGNLGVKSCNIDIATEKGWIVDYNPNKVVSLVTAKNSVLFALEGVGSVLVDWGDKTSEPYKLPTKCSHNYKKFVRSIDELCSIDESLLHTINVTRINKTFSATHVNCNDNQLISLEIDEKQLYSIVSLSCSNNQLTNLSVAGLTNLIELDCRNNQLSAKALDLLFISLPQFPSKVSFGKLFIDGNLGVESCNIDIATEKGWIVDYNPNKMVLVTAGNNVSFVCGGSGSVLVNWGDGTNNIYRTPECQCIHHYDSSGEHTITITGGSITLLKCSDNALKSLDVSKNITLEELWCSNNQLTSLTVNRNINLKTLECIKNSISELDTSRLTKLSMLKCSYNLLSHLDVSNNLALETLFCDDNKLTHLVVCGFANLHTLSCENNSLTLLYCYNNQLTSLSFGGNSELEVLHCGGNKLAGLDVKGLVKLRFLNCGNNNLSGLKLMEQLNGKYVPLLPVIEQLYCYGNELKDLVVYGCVHLKILNCANNPLLRYIHCGHNSDGAVDSGLASLDISNNTSLVRLVCCHNSQLSSLDISDCINLEFIQALGCQIASLDVSKHVKLVTLTVNHNKLTHLDVSNNTELEYLQCHANPLTTLDINKLGKLKHLWSTGLPLDLSKNTALEYLFCPYYPLTSLNLRNNTALKTLKCYNSNLIELDVSRNTVLETLVCYNNKLTELNVSNNSKIRSIDCRWCGLKENGLGINEVDKLFESLPDCGKEADGTIKIATNPGAKSCNPEIAKKKGWTVIMT
jgi:Leucine-rich repeat (LRR) protein